MLVFYRLVPTYFDFCLVCACLANKDHFILYNDYKKYYRQQTIALFAPIMMDGFRIWL